MTRKTFLSRIDNSGAVNGTVSNKKKQQDFIKSANKFAEQVLTFLLQRVPGFHDFGKKRGHSSHKRKHKHSRILGI